MLVCESQSLEAGATEWQSWEEKGLLWRLSSIDRREETKNYALGLVNGKLLICSEPSFTVITKSDIVSVAYEAKFNWKGILLGNRAFKIESISGKQNSRGMEAEEFVRLIHALMREEQR